MQRLKTQAGRAALLRLWLHEIFALAPNTPIEVDERKEGAASEDGARTCITITRGAGTKQRFWLPLPLARVCRKDVEQLCKRSRRRPIRPRADPHREPQKTT